MREILNQAATLFAIGHISEAEQLYRQVLDNDPNNASAYWGLGRVAMQAINIHAAIDHFEKAIKLLPTHPLPIISLAQAYEELRKFDVAGNYYRKAADIAPENAYAQYMLGVYFSEAGAIDDAEERFRTAIGLNPNHAYAFYELSKLKLFSSTEDADLKAIEQLLTQPDIKPSDQIAGHFALGKAFDDIGEPDRAFDNFAKANAMQRAGISFGVEDMKPLFKSVKQIFDTEFFRSINPGAELALTPIFIVGLPRTGSSLLEAILSGHSEIFAAGELPYLGRDVVGALSRETKKPFPQACADIRADDSKRLAQIYLDNTQPVALGARFVTDKLPANFQSIGLIKKIMPQAKVINLRRDPMDTGFSIFKNFFNENEPYFCDLSEIGEYFRLYEDIMTHWRRELPGFVLDVDYEDLVADPKNTTSKILKFCGLDWQDACLNLARQPAYVRTLSKQQIRRSVNTDSIGSWRAYEKHLQPLKLTLCQI